MSRKIDRADRGRTAGGPRAAETAPEGFTWRGIAFEPPPPGGMSRFYKSALIELEDRTADWKCELIGKTWHARLRIGGDRFPGAGATHGEALDHAATEAESVIAFIVAMLPPKPAAAERAPRKSRKGSASKGGK